MKRSPVPPNLYPPLTPRTRAAPGIRSLVNPPISIEYFKLKTFYDGWKKKVEAIRGSLHGSGLSLFLKLSSLHCFVSVLERRIFFGFCPSFHIPVKLGLGKGS